MARNDDELLTIRQYLLGQLVEDRRQEFEHRLLTKDDLFEVLEITEDELIDEYLAEKLSWDERKVFEENFLGTSERNQKLRFAQALKKYITATTVHRTMEGPGKSSFKNWWRWPQFSAPWAVAAAILIVLSLGAAVWRGFFYKSDVDKGLLALNAAYRQQRPVEARISRLDYAPFSTVRGSSETERVDITTRDHAERYLLDALANNPNPAAHHALGKLYLAKKEFQKSISHLEEALKGDPNNAQIYADLGAAFLEKGKIEIEKGKTDNSSLESGKGLEDLARSLENLNKALELDSNLLEALFNRALCHQYMPLPQQAANDWMEYLKKDSTSPWAEEARRNLKALVNANETKSSIQVLQDFMEAYNRRDNERAWQILSQSREMITGTMIPLQLTQTITRNRRDGRVAEWNSDLSVLLYSGELESQRARDPFVLDVAHYYAAVSTDQQQSLSIGHTETDAGYESCLAARFDHALKHFEQARASFESGQDIWEMRLTDYWIGYCYSRIGRISESTKLLDELAQYARLRGYKWLLMQALSWTANNDSLQRDYSKSLEYDGRALQLADEIADTYMQQKILAQIAQEYGRLAAPRRSLSYIQRALSLSDLYYVSLRQQWRNYNFAADTLYDLRLFSAAADCGRESLRLAEDRFEDPTTKHDSLVRLGRLYGGLHNFPEAIRLVEQSLQISKSLSPGPSAQALSAFSNLQLANLEKLSGDCRSALSYYNESVRFYEPNAHSGFSVNYYNSRKGRLACYAELNEDLAVAQELPLVLDLFEQHRSTILEEENRNTFFDREQGVYDTAISYEYSRHNPELAFDYSERSRARSLLDALHNNAKVATSGSRPETVFSDVASPLNLKEIRTRMPEQVQLVQYAVLPEKLIIWVVSRSQCTVVEQPIKASTLNSMTVDFELMTTTGSETNSSEARNLAVELYEALIKPIESLLDPQHVIGFIPDKGLCQLSFAALVSPQTNDYLITKYSLLYSPSSSVFVLSTEAAKQKTVFGSERIVSLGNPAFDRDSYPDLPDLPTASREARTVAGFYRKAACLLGYEAAKKNFSSEMLRSEVIHFAGHYLPDETSPLQSRLLLAKRKGSDDGVLTVQDLVERKFSRPRLIVLSACRTELEHYYNGEGAIGISRGFLGAGIPLVVASQWTVDSEATEQLMIAFHRYRTQSGVTTPAALQRAQLDLLNNPENSRFRNPYYWAGFMALGGYTTF